MVNKSCVAERMWSIDFFVLQMCTIAQRKTNSVFIDLLPFHKVQGWCIISVTLSRWNVIESVHFVKKYNL